MSATQGTQGAGSGQAGNATLAYQLTSGKAYDPDAVYADASDARGHYEQVNVKLPPRLEHVMDILVAEHDNLRSRQDFIRNAVMHMSYQMATNGVTADPLAEQLVEAEANHARMDMRRRVREAQRREYEETKEEVDDLIADKDWNAINEIMDRVALLCDNPDIPEGQRERYNDLYMEMTDAVTRQRSRDIKARNRGTR